MKGRKHLLKFADYSFWERLRKLTAWIQQFCKNAWKSKKDHDSGELRAEKLEDADIYWLKYIQEENFLEEIQTLKTNNPIPNYSKIFRLGHFLSEKGLLLTSFLFPTRNGRHFMVPLTDHLKDMNEKDRWCRISGKKNDEMKALASKNEYGVSTTAGTREHSHWEANWKKNSPGNFNGVP
ncbi:hypothetical protein NPIL_136301 [Nephila pilipes]|uniref:Uncharacterized protein n=1 Tax=Nephila pilipes TaxID=299642 RepID=A0A8X6U9H6_NEPPI|nr:hypothetical protein NPIL_136301 [Nephila pilipes]